MSSSGPRRGIMLVISSPSGAGKTTLCRRLAEDHPDIVLSVSATTRDPRPGEKNGREYHFIDKKQFDDLLKRHAFLEWAHVHEHRYGTPKDSVMGRVEAGHDVLFDIDWQGAQQVAKNAPGDVVRIFILPPSMKDLSRRLHARAQDREDVIQRRLGRAYGEIPHWNEYDYVLVNDDVDETYIELEAIYRAEKLKRQRVLGLESLVQRLLEEPLE
ncbi:MAG: guanylate kinase [Alphaproteobacteria bacterium]